MFKVYLIGAGQIGSRHLQALKKVGRPLDITVIDPSEKSLKIAKERYEEVAMPQNVHKINFLTKIPQNKKIDLAIIATTSNVRAKIIKSLLKTSQVRFMILEKLLFDKKKDHQAIGRLFSQKKVKAWVNCPLRLRPIYQKIKKDLAGQPISFRVIGSRLGLATNSIHFLDLASWLTSSTDFTVNTEFLGRKIITSKRKGFLELNGTLYVRFQNKLSAEFTSYFSNGATPLVEVFNENVRYIFPFQEADAQCLVSRSDHNWQWEKFDFLSPFVSETTTWVVENIIKKSDCDLTPYQESAKIHLALLEPLRQFINQKSKKKYDYYPFT